MTYKKLLPKFSEFGKPPGSLVITAAVLGAVLIVGLAVSFAAPAPAAGASWAGLSAAALAGLAGKMAAVTALMGILGGSVWVAITGEPDRRSAVAAWLTAAAGAGTVLLLALFAVGEAAAAPVLAEDGAGWEPRLTAAIENMLEGMSRIGVFLYFAAMFGVLAVLAAERSGAGGKD